MNRGILLMRGYIMIDNRSIIMIKLLLNSSLFLIDLFFFKIVEICFFCDSAWFDVPYFFSIFLDGSVTTEFSSSKSIEN